MLRLSGVAKTYHGGIRALQNISLDIPRGLFGLLGPNGAGKSTLMRTIATLQSPDSGTITFDGIDVLRDKTALRRVLGYLPQEFGACPRTSAETMLRHLAALKGIHGPQQKQAVEHLLVRTNLWEARHRSVDTFSGGMKQRFGIAQALLGNPRLLIVDEPTAGLDPAERRRFQNLLAEVGEEMVVILSSFGRQDARAQLWSQLRMDLRGAMHSPVFWLVLLLAVYGTVSESQSLASDLMNLPLHPLTGLMLSFFRFGLFQFVLTIVIVFSGQLIHREPDNEVVANGTFVNLVDIMPLPSYDEEREVTNPSHRRQLGLPAAPRLPTLGDPAHLGTLGFGVDGRMDFRVIVSTSLDQTAVAPGVRQREWTAEGRRYFEYVMDTPIWPSVMLCSARYTVARDSWKGVALEVYHDAKHPWNVPAMLKTAKQSFEYFSREFGPYPLRYFRILEYPRYRGAAQAFPGATAYSESAGFVTDLSGCPSRCASRAD